MKVTASCSCGSAHETIAIGQSMQFSGCYFPCLCEDCHRVVQVDVVEEPPRCPACHSDRVIPYDDPKLISSPGDVVVHCGMREQLGRVLELTDGRYYCPACGQMNLQFTTGWNHARVADT